MSYLTSDPNQTENTDPIIRPPYFFISGFIDIPHMDYYYIFLCFVYIISLVGNTFVMMVIYMDNSLHRYHMMVTHRSMFQLTGAAWAFAVFLVSLAVFFITRLSFCRSLVINSYFCDHGPLFRLAAPCSDVVPNIVISYLNPCIVLYFPMVFIISSYICITHALFTITLPQDRVRGLKTCTSHLILVAIFYLPINITYLLHPIIPTNARIFNLSLTLVLPPMLNPFVYVLKTEEFKESAKKLLRECLAQCLVFAVTVMANSIMAVIYLARNLHMVKLRLNKQVVIRDLIRVLVDLGS
uniref:olfactory receptor 6B1-like n=1 Tax=Oncorhynchus gorbuscha TaxID=8017 RepID=UPI001EAF5A15|nr:olfactory receptor 6B1-like [Oncorhynchus gorbuscha]